MTEIFDFDRVVERRGTCCEKWDDYPGAPDALPMWVADMDFAAPSVVTDALRARVDHGVFGYTCLPEETAPIACNWRRQRCGHGVQEDWMVLSTGVVCSIKAALLAFTAPGDAVVVQTPIYPPFVGVPAKEGRRVVRNPLVLDNGRWRMDLAHLECCFAEGARVLIFCASHNPVGRVWTREELADLAALCVRYDVLVVSDEIHCDILRPGQRHTALAALPGMRDRVLTLVSTTKSFNLAGLQCSVAFVADQDMRERLKRELYRCNHAEPNVFGLLAQNAAWGQGGPWLDELNAYIAGNVDCAMDILAQQPLLKAIPPQGTYLLWVDCTALGMDEPQLQQFFIQRCRVYPSMGRGFGASGWVRLNLATRRALVQEALGRIVTAVQEYRRG